MDFEAAVLKQKDEIIAWRRDFRKNPELSCKEFETQKKIMALLTGWGLQPKKAAGTGIIADIKGALPGKTIAVRADMDALLLQDELDKPYRSANQGVSHACGHDGHMAMLLGLAKTLVELQAELPGTVRFLFQPSEEQLPGGAAPMIAAGALESVDYVLGTHVWKDVPSGKVLVLPEAMMAAPDEFSIEIQGRGGHGSLPHQTVDPIWIGAQIINALKTITSSLVNPMEHGVVSVGIFKSGDAFNIIPNTALIKGTVRTFDDAVRNAIHDHIRKMSSGIANAMGAQCKVDIIKGYPPVINNPEVASVVAQASKEALGEDGLFNMPPVLGAEDFSHYLEKTKGAFFFLGIGNEAAGSVYPHHHPRFDLDEEMLPKGVEIMLRSIWKLGKQ